MKTAYVALLCGAVATAAVSIAAADDKPADSENKTQAAAARPVWSYLPVQAPAVPSVQDKAWVQTPIDSFILAKLEEKGIRPSPEADRAVFIRRATLDAWGLIPTPEEVKAFADDASPDAYEKLVDRLLASPRYGERQARRWLDLARYAARGGFENDETRHNRGRQRDYVIKAL